MGKRSAVSWPTTWWCDMKIALLADIHANYPAFSKVLGIAKKEKVDLYLIAGDILGFYPFPAEVLEVLKNGLEAPIIMVAGNHDRKIVKGEPFADSYTATVMAGWQRGVLDPAQLAFIAGLPEKEVLEADGRRILLLHGSPDDPLNGRLKTPEDLPEMNDADIVIFGHTHCPMVVQRNGVLWINPGAVGQPRDGDSRASMGILTLPQLEVKIIRLEYDIDLVATRWLNVSPAGLDERLVQWLREGRYPIRKERHD